MFDNFGRRLQRDLKTIVDDRILNSEHLSGGLMRVRAHIFCSYSRYLCVRGCGIDLITDDALAIQTQSTGVNVNVVSHKRQRYAVWFGGSLLASTVRSIALLLSRSLLLVSKLTEFSCVNTTARILFLLSYQSRLR